MPSEPPEPPNFLDLDDDELAQLALRHDHDALAGPAAPDGVAIRSDLLPPVDVGQ